MEVTELNHLLEKVKGLMNARTYEVYSKAQRYCIGVLDQASQIIDDYLSQRGVNKDNICFVAVGSVGRFEALQASDLDFIPILKDKDTLKNFLEHDREIRNLLRSGLNLKISKGEDLTKCIDLDSLTSQEAIGGNKDSSTLLTKRILVLTEGRQIAGNLRLQEIRRKILSSYAGAERTRGRHVLSLCNDIARYYRTLCIEYKAKVDLYDKDWCTRNIKLRHSRKFWYFSLIISTISLAATHPEGEQVYFDGLLKAFEVPPYLRIFYALGEKHGVLLGKLLERYAWYLEFMSNSTHREALAKITHAERYNSNLGNPFPQMKLNSDMLANDMFQIINGLEGFMQQRIYEWFLL